MKWLVADTVTDPEYSSYSRAGSYIVYSYYMEMDENRKFDLLRVAHRLPISYGLYHLHIEVHISIYFIVLIHLFDMLQLHS